MPRRPKRSRSRSYSPPRNSVPPSPKKEESNEKNVTIRVIDEAREGPLPVFSGNARSISFLTLLLSFLATLYGLNLDDHYSTVLQRRLVETHFVGSSGRNFLISEMATSRDTDFSVSYEDIFTETQSLGALGWHCWCQIIHTFFISFFRICFLSSYFFFE